MVEIVGHSQTKGRDNREPKLRPKPARQSSTLPMSGMWRRSHGGTIEAPPDERGGNRYVLPNATAPHLDSTKLRQASMSVASPLIPQHQTFADVDFEIAAFRSPMRAHPICSSSQTDFMMLSRLMGGVTGHFLT